MKRFLYLLYYIRKLDWKRYRKFVNHTAQLKNKSKIVFIVQSVYAVFRYNISLLEFFQFRFFELDSKERKQYAGTGYMYEYQLLMNPKAYRPYLEDKRLFLEKFRSFVRHQYADLDTLLKDHQLCDRLLGNPSGRLILKKHDGQCGWGVRLIHTAGMNGDGLIKELRQSNNNLAEEFILQHPDLMRLSPSGLNTVRIITQLNARDEVILLGCRMRITVNSVVDNMAAGNIAAPIDEKTGIITGPGVYSDITKPDEIVHPVTGVSVVGFQVPFWNETVQMIKDAALSFKECRSIGWDIAITAEGPELVEGNHDWCKLVWQMPVKIGLKNVLIQHENELRQRDNDE